MAPRGLIGGTALLVLIAGYRRAPAALVAPFQYSQMLWAILLGWLIWGDLPDAGDAARRRDRRRERPVHPLSRDARRGRAEPVPRPSHPQRRERRGRA